MHFDILTLFPQMFYGILENSIIHNALERGIIAVNLVDIRDYSFDKHRRVDDYPYGGGAGMVMKPEPIFRAFDELETYEKTETCNNNWKKIFVSPQGQVYNQEKAREYSTLQRVTILCGHYEGVDERVREQLIDEEISLGDFVLTGGEIPAMAILDSVARLLPGVLGGKTSIDSDSFNDYLLEHPHYTRPFEYRGHQVPEILCSGDHQKIARWRLKESFRRTLKRRPELLNQKHKTEEELTLLEEIYAEEKTVENKEHMDDPL